MFMDYMWFVFCLSCLVKTCRLLIIINKKMSANSVSDFVFFCIYLVKLKSWMGLLNQANTGSVERNKVFLF